MPMLMHPCQTNYWSSVLELVPTLGFRIQHRFMPGFKSNLRTVPAKTQIGGNPSGSSLLNVAPGAHSPSAPPTLVVAL